jgi:hypothetical protein
MKKIISFVIILTTVCTFFVSCENSAVAATHGEYEVISVAAYEVIVGSDSNGPITEVYLAFIYMDSGSAFMRKDYQEGAVGSYDNCILIGESNKYVVVCGHREIDEFLYLTQETYDSIFSEVETNE